MKLLFEIFLASHGLLHMPAIIKAYFPDGKASVSKPSGLFWLSAAAAFFITTAMLHYNNYYWWICCCGAIILSQWNIMLHWKETKFGTLVNLVIMIITLDMVANS